MADVPPPIDHRSMEDHYTTQVLHIEECTSTQCRKMRKPSPPNPPQVYRALLHQTSRTYWKICTYPVQTDPPSQAQVYRDLLHQTSITYWEMRRPSPADWPQVYRALLHQTSITFWQIWTYPVQTDPPTGPNLLIKPKCREPYHTKPV